MDHPGKSRVCYPIYTMTVVACRVVQPVNLDVLGERYTDMADSKSGVLPVTLPGHVAPQPGFEPGSQ